MKYAWFGCLLFSGLLFAGKQDSDINVNTRYTVETVVVSGKGFTTDLGSGHNEKISSGLWRDMAALIGQKLNPAVLDELAERLKKEFSAREVTHHVTRGDSPEHVRVEFDVKSFRGSADARGTKLLYSSKEGWSGGGEVGFTLQQNSFAFGLVSDSDTLAERFAGVTARYENQHVGTDRVGLRFQFESYHEQWNRNTLAEAAAGSEVTSDAYRTRQNFQPAATIVLAKPLTLEVGVSFERLQNQYPAAHTEAANALISTLRYHRRLEGSDNQQDLDAGYTLRAATKLLDSDFVYVSHSCSMRYQLTHGKHKLSDDVAIGAIGGRAPLYDRFVLGNSYYLRGWNKYDLDPTGGNRMVHNSVEYRYRHFKVFYDTGAVWDSGQPATARHSLGVGLHESGFTLAVAFPVKSGRAEPIFMMGLMY